jgi:alkanesulfonate monooxygenase SsuD/methylene tetrahydromethanopterin reductase-like flavin-dependent oxidoreductase (luciferase family)
MRSSPLITLHPAWGLEGWLPLAALAVKTERIRLASHVNCIFYRHPVLLARLTADLDHISSGRLIQGLGCGWDTNEFANFGMPFPPARERQAALEEAITIIALLPQGLEQRFADSWSGFALACTSERGGKYNRSGE